MAVKSYFFALAWVPMAVWAQVGVGTSSPAASSILDVTATDKGFLPPRMTAAQRTAISSPATGLIVYQTDGTSGLYIYSGSAWIPQASWYTTAGSPTSSFTLVTPAGLTSGANANYGIGANALNALTSVDYNVALGYDAAKSVSTGADNTAVGYSALSATTGSGNTAFGSSAGAGNVSGTNNTFLGQLSDASPNNLTNATAIGYGATVTASNTIQLGNGSVTNVNTSGTITTTGSVGIGTTSPNSAAALEIVSTTKGLLLPRLTTIQRNSIAQPPAGLVIYNTTTNTVQGYGGSSAEWLNTNATYAGSVAIYNNSPVWQTFTATSSENITSVEAYVQMIISGQSTSVIAKIYSGNYDPNATPTQTPIATSSSTSVTASSYSWKSFSFSSPASLTNGSLYSVVLFNSGSDVDVAQATNNPYSGGSRFGDGLTEDLLLKIHAIGQWTNF
jgi:hypothetical protein